MTTNTNILEYSFKEKRKSGTEGHFIIREKGKLIWSDYLDIANNKHRKKLIKDIQKEFPDCDSTVLYDGVKGVLLEELHRITSPEETSNEDKSRALTREIALEGTPQGVKEAALDMLHSEDLFELISADIEALGVAGEEQLLQILYIIMTSRLLDKPAAAIVTGASASGKSFIIETIAEMIPDEDILKAHDISEQALYYLNPGSLIHRAVIAGERLHDKKREGLTENNSKAFRELSASGRLSKIVTEAGRDGKHITRIIEQQGPIAYIESTTATNIQDEDSTRLLRLSTNESAEQTQIIIDAMKQKAKGKRVNKVKLQEIIHRHHSLQRLLKQVVVRIPYIDMINPPSTNVATRRIFPQIIALLSAVTLLRQYQKEMKTCDGVPYIEADEEDYRIAYSLLDPIVQQAYNPISTASKELLNKIMEKTKDKTNNGEYEPFTRQKCIGWVGISETAVRQRLSPLVWEGVCSLDKDSKPYKYCVVSPDLVNDFVNVYLPKPKSKEEIMSSKLEEKKVKPHAKGLVDQGSQGCVPNIQIHPISDKLREIQKQGKLLEIHN